MEGYVIFRGGGGGEGRKEVKSELNLLFGC